MRTMVAYSGVFVLVLSFLFTSYHADSVSSEVGSVYTTSPTSIETTKSDKVSVDQLTAANLITDLAEATNLPSAGELRETTTTLYIKKQLSQNDAEVISKPQIVQPESSSERGITTYVTKDGDTMATIADSFHISAQTLKWANNTTSDTIESGKTLTVPLTDGVLYTVADGDTVQSIADKYHVQSERVILYNDLDSDSTLAKDTKLVLPNGDLPETERPGYVAPPAVVNNNNTNSGRLIYLSGNVGNRYASGYCTWYAYERRPDIGSFWGNASNWANSATANGFTVVRGVPRAGAIFQYGGGLGHVGIVESVDFANGTMRISDMNGIAGFGQVGYATVSINSSWNYIY